MRLCNRVIKLVEASSKSEIERLLYGRSSKKRASLGDGFCNAMQNVVARTVCKVVDSGNVARRKGAAKSKKEQESRAVTESAVTETGSKI